MACNCPESRREPAPWRRSGRRHDYGHRRVDPAEPRRRSPSRLVPGMRRLRGLEVPQGSHPRAAHPPSEEHTSELQSPYDLECRLQLEKKKQTKSNGSGNNVNSNKTKHKTRDKER